MARYSIDEKILTDLADGIRTVIGKENGVPAIVEAEYEFSTTGTTDETNYCSEPFKIQDARRIAVKDLKIEAETDEDIYFKVGYTSYLPYRYMNLNPGVEYKYGSDLTPNIFNVATESGCWYVMIGVRTANNTAGVKLNISFTATGLDANNEVLVNKEIVIPYEMTPEQMIEEINGLGSMPVIPDEAFLLTGNCARKFENGSLNWMVDLYGDRFTSKDLTDVQAMFNNAGLENIPFELNCKSNGTVSFDHTFCNNNFKTLPKINGKPKPSMMSNFISTCKYIRYLPEDIEDWFDWTNQDTSIATYSGYRGSNVISYCNSLRQVPMGFINHENPFVSSYNHIYNGLFYQCYSLDEVIDLPIPRASEMKWTSNMFSDAFKYCYRLKNLTFATNEDGTPIQVNWKSQVIDLTMRVGYAEYPSYILDYNSGITADKEVKDADTYQALKNDPDYYSSKLYFSRYNHDSAVRTINSLPDTTSSGGTNHIKFLGLSGRDTDGGAINTLTAEEIAVATEKGWTVMIG